MRAVSTTPSRLSRRALAAFLAEISFLMLTGCGESVSRSPAPTTIVISSVTLGATPTTVPSAETTNPSRVTGDIADSLASYIVVDGRQYQPVYAYKPYLVDSLLGESLGTVSGGTSVPTGSPVRAIKGVDPGVAVAAFSKAPGYAIASHGGILIRVPLGGWVPCYRIAGTLATPTPLPSRPSWATTTPAFDFLPTPTPRPTIGASMNPAKHYHLKAAADGWAKGIRLGKVIHDATLRNRLADALDTTVAVEHLPVEHFPPFDRSTVVVVFAVGTEQQAFWYHIDTTRVYVREDGIAFAAPAPFVAALAAVASGTSVR